MTWLGPMPNHETAEGNISSSESCSPELRTQSFRERTEITKNSMDVAYGTDIPVFEVNLGAVARKTN